MLSRRRSLPTRVILASPRSTAKPGSLPLGADDHRAQLQELEVGATLADARLPVEHRPTVLELHSHGREPEEGARDDEPGPGDREIEQAVQTRVPSATSHVAGTPRRR